MTAIPVRAAERPGCLAPSSQLFLNPQGAVAPCARRLAPLGNVAERSLLEIWEGVERARLVAALREGDYSSGCENCGAEVQLEGWEGSYPAGFDAKAHGDGVADEARRWPAWIDFNISNTCNLQCLQCSGELSSAIRSQRERRPPLPEVYDDRFYEDLRHFIPHLQGAHFAGGEPFLASENYRIWDLIAELRPDLPITVTTNGTTFTPRVERVLERLRFSFVISMDGITPETYRRIRVGGDLEAVLGNVERFRAYAARVGTTVTVNHCLMVQNHHEFADFLLWWEERGVHVDVSVVRDPTTCSLARLPAEELRAVHGTLVGRDREVRSLLRLNLGTWDTELARIGRWARDAAADPERSSRWGQRVLLFRQVGEGPCDDAAARSELASLAEGGVVHVLEVGLDDVIRRCSDSLVDAFPQAAGQLVGRHFDAVQEVSVGLFGPLERYEELSLGPDRADLQLRFGSTELRVAMVACRATDGVARQGRILIAIVPGPQP